MVTKDAYDLGVGIVTPPLKVWWLSRVTLQQDYERQSQWPVFAWLDHSHCGLTLVALASCLACSNLYGLPGRVIAPCCRCHSDFVWQQYESFREIDTYSIDVDAHRLLKEHTQRNATNGKA